MKAILTAINPPKLLMLQSGYFFDSGKIYLFNDAIIPYIINSLGIKEFIRVSKDDVIKLLDTDVKFLEVNTIEEWIKI